MYAQRWRRDCIILQIGSSFMWILWRREICPVTHCAIPLCTLPLVFWPIYVKLSFLREVSGASGKWECDPHPIPCKQLLTCWQKAQNYMYTYSRVINQLLRVVLFIHKQLLRSWLCLYYPQCIVVDLAAGDLKAVLTVLAAIKGAMGQVSGYRIIVLALVFS